MGSVAVLLRTQTNMDVMATEPFLPSDESLAIQVQQGDQRSFATLVERHGNRFFGLANRFLNDPQEAQDMVQTAFFKFWQNPWHWDSNRQTRFTTWFYRVVVNLCLDFKKKKREQHPETMPEATFHSDADTKIDKAKEQLRLRNQIKSLPQNQQIALELCFYQGLSNEEASQMMGIRLKALQSLLVRAKQKLKLLNAKVIQVKKS
jgi:RNA polymerase sigma-70 factor (ECF subfamily)